MIEKLPPGLKRKLPAFVKNVRHRIPTLEAMEDQMRIRPRQVELYLTLPTRYGQAADGPHLVTGEIKHNRVWPEHEVNGKTVVAVLVVPHPDRPDETLPLAFFEKKTGK